MNLQLAHPNKLATRLLSSARNSMPLRYRDLGLMCVGVLVMLTGVGAIAPIRAIYARDHGASMAEIGLMASAFLLGGLLFQLPGGWASDKWGRKPLMVFGLAAVGVITFLFLLNDHPWYFIALRFLEGAAAGPIGPAANAYVMDAVPAKERGAAFGWLGSAFSAGFMLGPAIGGVMVDTFGYASPFIFGGIASIVMALFLLRAMSNRKHGGKTASVVEPDDTPEAQTASKRLIPKHLFVPALIGAMLLITGSGFGDGLFMSIWTIWLNDIHASTSFIGLTFVTFSLPLMLFMPMTGRWADKYNHAPLIAIPALLISLVYLAYGLTTNLPLILAIGPLEGTLLAIMVPAVSSFIANLSPENARGRLQGIISTTRTIAGVTSSMLVAILYKENIVYPFIMLAVVQVIVALVGGFLVWRTEKRTEASSALELRESLAA